MSDIQTTFCHPTLFVFSLDIVLSTEIMSENRKEGMVILKLPKNGKKEVKKEIGQKGKNEGRERWPTDRVYKRHSPNATS